LKVLGIVPTIGLAPNFLKSRDSENERRRRRKETEERSIRKGGGE